MLQVRTAASGVPLDKSILLPAAIETTFDTWRPELRKYARGWAMVHSKVVVIDPFGDHPVLITGSHNMGPKASQFNDDNLVIIEGDAAAAQAHACVIMSIYDTYHWREYQLETQKTGKPNRGHKSRGQPTGRPGRCRVAGRRPTSGLQLRALTVARHMHNHLVMGSTAVEARLDLAFGALADPHGGRSWPGWRAAKPAYSKWPHRSR